jgi:hypothetical protein
MTCLKALVGSCGPHPAARRPAPARPTMRTHPVLDLRYFQSPVVEITSRRGTGTGDERAGWRV